MAGMLYAARWLRAATVVSALVLLSFTSAQADDAIYVDPNGNVGVGTSNPSSARLTVDNFSGIAGLTIRNPGGSYSSLPLNDGRIFITSEISPAASNDGRIFFRRYDGSGYTTSGVFNYNANYEFRVYGQIYCDGVVYSSSRRWKQNIRPLADPLVKVQRLSGVLYDWTADARQELELPEKAAGSTHVGLIAEDVAAVVPEAVTFEKGQPSGVDYAKLVPVLVEAIKAQQTQIEALQAKVDALTQSPSRD